MNTKQIVFLGVALLACFTVSTLGGCTVTTLEALYLQQPSEVIAADENIIDLFGIREQSRILEMIGA